jgi:hypothetical protein
MEHVYAKLEVRTRKTDATYSGHVEGISWHAPCSTQPDAAITVSAKNVQVHCGEQTFLHIQRVH